MKKLIATIIAFLLLPLAVSAINITVPAAPGANYVLLSTTTGAYNPVATSSLGIISGVSSITGTADQVIASSPTGAVTLSLPQSINTTNNVRFASLSLGMTQVETLNIAGNGLFRKAADIGVLVDVDDTAHNASLEFRRQNTMKAMFGVSGSANALILDSAADDFAVRSNNHDIRFSVDNGITTKMSLDSSAVLHLQGYTSNGFLKTSGSNGTVSVDTTTYLSSTTASSVYVPYVGASTTVNLGSQNLTTSGLVTATTSRFVNATTTTLYATSTLAINATSTNLAITNLTNGSVLFATSSGVVSQDNANFFWDNTNKRLGLGTASPSYTLHVNQGGKAEPTVTLTSTNTTWGTQFVLDSSGAGGREYRYFSTGSANIIGGGKAGIFDATAAAFRLTVDSAGLVGIGTTTPTSALHVYANGNATHYLTAENHFNGTAAVSLIQTLNNSGKAAFLTSYSDSYTGITGLAGNQGLGGSNSFYIFADGGVSTGGTHSINFLTGGYTPATQTRMTINSDGSTQWNKAGTATIIQKIGASGGLIVGDVTGDLDINSWQRIKITTATDDGLMIRGASSQSGAFLKVASSAASANSGDILTLFSTGNLTVGSATAYDRVTAVTAAGSYGFTHTDGTRKLSTFVSASGGFLGTQSNNSLFFFTNGGAAQMTLLTTGNVGIGETNPGNRLVVAASDSATTPDTLTAVMGLKNTNTTNGNFSVMAFQGQDTGGTVQGLGRQGIKIDSHAVGAMTASYYVDVSTAGTPNQRFGIDGATGKVMISSITPQFTRSAALLANGGQLQVYGNTSEGILVASAGAGVTPFISGRSSRGTIASPTATQADDVLLRNAGGGYQSTTGAYTGGVGAFEVHAAENFTSTAQGTYLMFRTTPVGSVTEADAWKVEANGALSLINKATGYLGYYPDTNNRGILHIGSAGVLNDANIVFLGNRVASGVVQIGGNSSTAGSAGETLAAQFAYNLVNIYQNTTWTDAKNLAFGTTNGTKIGTATSQKLGFWNATPVVQQSGDILSALSTTGLVASPAISYGNMYIYTLGGGSTTITVSATDTWYQIASGVTGGLTNGFTFQNARELKVTTAGVYRVVWSLGVEAAAANQEIEGTVMVNGTATTSMAAHTEAMTANTTQGMGGSGIVRLSANDLLSLAVLNHTATQNITIDHLTLTVSRVE